jgi:peptide methionine sulfoxide reductase MsrB
MFPKRIYSQHVSSTVQYSWDQNNSVARVGSRCFNCDSGRAHVLGASYHENTAARECALEIFTNRDEIIQFAAWRNLRLPQ